MHTQAAYIQSLRQHIPSHIVSEEAFERIYALTSHFPASLADRLFDFEIYLRETRVDFAWQFRALDENWQLLSQVSSRFAHPIWQKISSFSSQWGDRTSLLHSDTDNIWLAFDLAEPGATMPVPSLFYCSISVMKPSPDPSTTIKLLASIFRSPEEADLLANSAARCIQSLPGQAQINQVGFGLLRNADALRLQIVNFSPQEIPVYLKTIGWNYATEPLLPFLEQFAIGDLLSLMIDVSTNMQAKISLECILEKQDSRWQMVLDYLIRRELCSPEKRDFLVHLPSVKLCQVDRRVSLTRQALSHIKVSYNPQQISAPFEAKAYLSYYPGWYLESADDNDGKTTQTALHMKTS
ncbi:hypothetical protein EPA93_16375 [Ktedonosporobacter rubrisoli]|uniref:Uncharacterized protein n=1 Tax=Ktedonosporobacter rubrisoli TaxID=2509675 RepID=A0A4P6JQM8_KTERU|nr:hypothetical protein [Ktedonosporobacter rubrisoli]QBD77480.1 hypothetical protein EPA93_16375 [Ktedonosporobacter rubrisoli]